MIRRRASRIRLALAACTLGACLLAAPSQASLVADFTWSGATPAGAGASNWSNTTNWVGGTAPSGSVGTLTFPALNRAACAADPATEACYESNNDLTGITANAISIDDEVGYLIEGNAITLGAGGLSATTSSSTQTNPHIALPITLGADQTWTINAGAARTGGLNVDAVTGAHALAINFTGINGGGYMSFNGDSEVGALTVTAGDSFTGINLSGKLNATDGSAVNLNTAGLYATDGNNSTGPLTAVNGHIQVGQGSSPDGNLAVNGAVTLDSGSLLALHIDQPGTSPGTDFSQLTASGPVNLGGANLKVHWGDQPACTPLHVGDVDTLVQTTGALTGTFHDDANQNVPNGTVVELINHCVTGTAPTVRINYTPNSVTATVVTAGSTSAQPSPPASTSPPTVHGTPQQGSTLTESHGAWSGSPSSFTYGWQRCDGAGNNCAPIAGAASQTYTLTASDVGHTIRVREVASNGAGDGNPATSARTGVVKPPPPTSTQIKSSLLHQLAPKGRAAKIGAIRKARGYAFSFKALSAGVARIDWYYTRHGKKPVLVATGKLTFSAAGKHTLKVKLTPAGRRLLKHARRAKLTGKGSFKPTGRPTLRATKPFTLRG